MCASIYPIDDAVEIMFDIITAAQASPYINSILCTFHTLTIVITDPRGGEKSWTPGSLDSCLPFHKGCFSESNGKCASNAFHTLCMVIAFTAKVHLLRQAETISSHDGIFFPNSFSLITKKIPREREVIKIGGCCC